MAFLGVEYGAKFTLTGPDGTVVVFNDSTDPNYVGVLNPESSGLDSPEVREEAAEAVEADGGIHGAFFAGRRPVILQGTVISGGSATIRNERVDKLLRATNALRADATLKWKPVGATEEVELKLRRQQPVRITKGFTKEFQLPMVSADSRILGTGSQTASKKGEAFKTTTLNPASIDNQSFQVNTFDELVALSPSASWVTPENAKVEDGTNTTAEFAAGGRSSALHPTLNQASLPALARVFKFIGKARRKKNNANGEIASQGWGLQYKTGVYKQFVHSEPLWTEAFVTESTSAFEPTIPVPVSELKTALYFYTLVTGTGTPRIPAVDWIGLEVSYYPPFEFTATNAGRAAASPKIKVTGPISRFEILNTTTGETISYTGTIAAGNYVLFDTKNKTALLNGVTDVYANVAFPTSWPQLTPGVNSFTVAGNEITAATEVLLTWQNAWE